MRIGVIGVNDKVANLKTREYLAKLCQLRFATDLCLDETTSTVLLSTCNRTEVYFSSEDVARTHTKLLELLRQDIPWEFEQQLYSFFGGDCLQHISRVTAGLDSAIIAETEIQGQVKTAYEAAATRYPLHSELHFAFQKALKIGKQVRQALPMRQGIPGLEHAIWTTASLTIPDLQNTRLLIVGASEINQKALAYLRQQGLTDITLCNRSQEGAEAMAKGHGIGTLPWHDLHTWRQFDWVIFGTKAPDYLLTQEDVELGTGRCCLLIDLSVPRNVDPAVGSNSTVQLRNIDELHDLLHMRKQHLSSLVQQAESIVDRAAQLQANLFKERESRRERFLAVGA